MRVSFDTSSSCHSLLSLSAMAAVSALAGCVSTPGTGRMVGRQSTLSRNRSALSTSLLRRQMPNWLSCTVLPRMAAF